MTRPSRLASPLAVSLAGLLSLAAAMGVGRFVFTPMLPLMIRDGQMDVALGGWVAAANYGGYLLGAVTAARIRLDAARLGVLALLLTVVLTAAMALPGPALLWMALRWLAGMCSAWAFVATSVWCLGALATLGRPSWGGGVYAGVGLGMVLTGLYCLGGAVAGVSASALWLQLAVLALLLTLPVVLVVRKLAPVSASHVAMTVGKGMAPRGTAGLVVCYGLMAFGYILPATYLPVLARSLVDDPRWFGLAWPLFGLTAALSTLLAGRWMRRRSRLEVWSLSQALMGLGVLLPSLWLSAWTIALSALLVGGTFMVITMAGVQEIRARAVGHPTAWVSRLTTAFAIGQIAGPVTATLLLNTPFIGAQGLSAALQIAALSLLASSVWLWRQKKATLAGGL